MMCEEKNDVVENFNEKTEKLEYTEDEFATERKRGKIFSILGLVLMVIALCVFVMVYETKIIPPNLAARVCYSGFLFLGMVIAMNGLVMIQAANIRLERSKEMKEKETRDGSENTKNGQ